MRFDFVVYVYIDIYSTCIVLKQEKEVEDLSLLFATGQDDLRGFQHIFFENSSIYIYIYWMTFESIQTLEKTQKAADQKDDAHNLDW